MSVQHTQAAHLIETGVLNLPEPSHRADSADDFDFDLHHARELRVGSVLTLSYRSDRPRFLSFHHAPGLHVHFRLAGTGRYRVNGSETIDGGQTEMQVYYSRKSWVKEVFERGESQSHSILFRVPEEMAKDFLNDHDLGPLDEVPTGFLHLRRRLSSGLVRDLREVVEMSEEGVAGLMKEARLLQALAGSFEAMRRVDAGTAGAYRVRQTDHERIAEVRDFMDRTLDREHRVAALAARAYMSESRFKTVFRAVTGQPVQSYLRQRRVNRAAELLAASATVSEAALAVGYAHPGHFARVFRDAYGIYPGEYAKD